MIGTAAGKGKIIKLWEGNRQAVGNTHSLKRCAAFSRIKIVRDRKFADPILGMLCLQLTKTLRSNVNSFAADSGKGIRDANFSVVRASTL